MEWEICEARATDQLNEDKANTITIYSTAYVSCATGDNRFGERGRNPVINWNSKAVYSLLSLINR